MSGTALFFLVQGVFGIGIEHLDGVDTSIKPPYGAFSAAVVVEVDTVLGFDAADGGGQGLTGLEPGGEISLEQGRGFFVRRAQDDVGAVDFEHDLISS